MTPDFFIFIFRGIFSLCSPPSSPPPLIRCTSRGKGGTHEAALAVAAPRGGVAVLRSSSASAMSRCGREADATGATMGRQGHTTTKAAPTNDDEEEELLAKREVKRLPDFAHIFLLFLPKIQCANDRLLVRFAL